MQPSERAPVTVESSDGEVVAVAVVTGANKGLGLAIAQGLLQRWPGLVYVTARDETRGRQAVEGLGPRALFLRLDVSDEDSVRTLAATLRARRHRLQFLVNNAAIAHLGETTPPQDAATLATNYGSLALMERHVFSLLVPGARVLNISSDCGHLSNVRDPHWLQVLASPALTVDDVDAFVLWFLQRRRAQQWTGQELAEDTAAAYRVSKVALSARSRLQASELAARNISVINMHPGLVRTDMTRGVGFLSAQDAADTPLWLLLEAPPSLSGAYVWYDRRELDWMDHTADYYFKAATLNLQQQF